MYIYIYALRDFINPGGRCFVSILETECSEKGESRPGKRVKENVPMRKEQRRYWGENEFRGVWGFWQGEMGYTHTWDIASQISCWEFLCCFLFLCRACKSWGQKMAWWDVCSPFMIMIDDNHLSLFKQVWGQGMAWWYVVGGGGGKICLYLEVATLHLQAGQPFYCVLDVLV